MAHARGVLFLAAAQRELSDRAANVASERARRPVMTGLRENKLFVFFDGRFSAAFNEWCQPSLLRYDRSSHR